MKKKSKPEEDTGYKGIQILTAKNKWEFSSDDIDELASLARKYLDEERSDGVFTVYGTMREESEEKRKD